MELIKKNNNSGRCEYSKTCQLLVQLFDTDARTYQVKFKQILVLSQVSTRHEVINKLSKAEKFFWWGGWPVFH